MQNLRPTVKPSINIAFFSFFSNINEVQTRHLTFITCNESPNWKTPVYVESKKKTSLSYVWLLWVVCVCVCDLCEGMWWEMCRNVFACYSDWNTYVALVNKIYHDYSVLFSGNWFVLICLIFIVGYVKLDKRENVK